MLSVNISGTRKRKKYGVHVIRYADDFIVTGKSKEILETKVKRLVEDFLSDRGLTLSTGKTKITHVEQGFDFLGQTVRKEDNHQTFSRKYKPTSEAHPVLDS
ncbi:MAG: reverse transcriptase domain-containing protein [Wolbachia endosymbiont of Armadillidium vulgare]|uniref:Reverse transcriptase domain-containing protein n=1 Tax=Wolbachia endosymbiont of Armadillidium arcangelii TaxID=3158571 RepID=A0AAU7Q2P0_9RICK|nr:reverse transcriptase domain-containing protein [Wolbachia endosymbiont of Armadillidium vulgare]